MTPEEFVAAFAQRWSDPDADRTAAILAEDVRLTQPLVPPVVGREAARESFAMIFRALPTLRLRVERWAADGDVIFIEWRASVEVAGRRFEWPGADRFVVRDGLVAERAAYFDPTELAEALQLAGRAAVSP